MKAGEALKVATMEENSVLMAENWHRCGWASFGQLQARQLLRSGGGTGEENDRNYVVGERARERLGLVWALQARGHGSEREEW